MGQPVEAAQDALRACELEPRSAAAHAARGAALREVEEGALAASEQADVLLRRLSASASASAALPAAAAAESGRGGGGHEETASPPPPAALRRQVDAGLANARAEVAGAGGLAAPAPAVAESQGVPTPRAADADAAASPPPLPPPPPPLPPPPRPPPPAVRRQWYQTPDRVVVDVFVKGVPPSSGAVRATFDPRMLRLRVDRAAGGPGAPAPPLPYELALPLWGEVRAAGARGGGGGGGGPPGCSVEVLRSKLEVTMLKAAPGVAWPFLDAARTEPAVGVAATAMAPAPPLPAAPAAAAAAGPSSLAGAAAGVAAAAPAYPSSRPPGARKDWSALEAEVEAMEAHGELDDGDELSAFFKKIFAGGDDETRRAMAKSYTESGGTVLSTNWKEVGRKTVEPTPPDGAEANPY
jgi:suppressor of G2 allele of SKP1